MYFVFNRPELFSAKNFRGSTLSLGGITNAHHGGKLSNIRVWYNKSTNFVFVSDEKKVLLR